MSSMWTAASDRDYYGDGEEARYYGATEPGEDPLDQYSANEISLFMADWEGDACSMGMNFASWRVLPAFMADYEGEVRA